VLEHNRKNSQREHTRLPQQNTHCQPA